MPNPSIASKILSEFSFCYTDDGSGSRESLYSAEASARRWRINKE
jgi:hypothetical protein